MTGTSFRGQVIRLSIPQQSTSRPATAPALSPRGSGHISIDPVSASAFYDLAAMEKESAEQEARQHLEAGGAPVRTLTQQHDEQTGR